MIDFGPVKRREVRLADFAKAQNINRDDLIRASEEMIDTLLQLIENLEQGDLLYIPNDPEAEDPYAENEEEVYVSWSIGHIIAHVTASSEECCAQGATLARGVEPCGRNRYEMPWESIRTLEDARQRLEESRRIRLAYLNAWPDQPHFETTFTPYKGPQNCVTRVLAGLFHEDGHLDQIRDAIKQAQTAPVLA
ncbi:MAG: DinB family protein [Chloroflexi bacterium]|nr:DinB family protein [Chloroflexota bacterium]